jgi:hypothetical protein
MSAPAVDSTYAVQAQTMWGRFVKGAAITASLGVLVLSLMAITLL